MAFELGWLGNPRELYTRKAAMLRARPLGKLIQVPLIDSVQPDKPVVNFCRGYHADRNDSIDERSDEGEKAQQQVS
jgi:hypothetical protein